MTQRRAPDALRGRIFSALNVEWQIGRPSRSRAPEPSPTSCPYKPFTSAEAPF